MIVPEPSSMKPGDAPPGFVGITLFTTASVVLSSSRILSWLYV